MCGALSCVARGSWGLGDVLGATWSGIGLSWMPLEPIGEGLGGLSGSSWALLGGSRRPLEAILVSPAPSAGLGVKPLVSPPPPLVAS